MSLEDKRREYFRNVWNHAIDPFQVQFDICKPLDSDELGALERITDVITRTEDNQILAELIRDLIGTHGSSLTAKLLQLCGLTRNKILSDLRASGNTVGTPSSYRGLHTSPIWDVAGPYLARCLRRVFPAHAKIRSWRL